MAVAAQRHHFARLAISFRWGSVGQQPQEQRPNRSDRDADEKNGTEDDERDQRRRSIGTGGHGASVARRTAAGAMDGPSGEIASAGAGLTGELTQGPMGCSTKNKMIKIKIRIKIRTIHW
jgi:hypothetical protein